MPKSMRPKAAMIIGGGYTGLACAVKLIDKGYSVFVVDQAAKPGGLGITHALSNGHQCEAFYHHFFIHDKFLIESCERFLKTKPIFVDTTMALYYNGKHHDWNGVNDLFLYPHISLFGKIRFIIATLLLSCGCLPKFILDRFSLRRGMRLLYGKNAYHSVWKPMLAGKFGNKLDDIPLRWMHGRLNQRLKSRKSGKERLGYLPGSLRPLTSAIASYITQDPYSQLMCNTSIEAIEYNSSLSSFDALVCNNCTSEYKNITVHKIYFTVPSQSANLILSTSGSPLDGIRFPHHEYFKAICVLIEMNSSLSTSYWTNIADESLFFCGYIEQTRLTGTNEYGGLHIAYLTKYLSLGEAGYDLNNDQIIKKAKICLSKLFPGHNLDSIIIDLNVMTAHNAQVVTGFGYVPPSMIKYKSNEIFLGNMSHVYPDERSINNAFRIGEMLATIST